MKIVRAVVIAAAWLFAGGTFLTLVMVIIGGLLHPGSVSRVCASGFSGQEPVVHIYQLPAVQTTETPSVPAGGSEDLREAIGLTYRGYAGVLLAAIQALFVAACAFLTVRGRGIQQRGAHLALSAWAALWLGNTVWIWITTPTNTTRTSAGIIAVFFGCTVLRAWISWNRDRSGHGVAHAMTA